MVNPIDRVRFLWIWQIPLPIQWEIFACDQKRTIQIHGNFFASIPPRFPAAAIREVALPFWITKAEKDPWTHDQLIALVGALREDQTMPGDLVAWSLDVISGLRSRPTRRGPKSDRARDTKLAWTFGALCRSGFSGRAAKRHIAERWNIDPTTVESAVRRARRVWEFPAK